MLKLKIKPLKNIIKRLKMMPNSAIPSIQISMTYIKLMERQFLSVIILVMDPLLMLSINIFILSVTSIRSFILIITEKTEPIMTPRNNTKIAIVLIFLCGKMILLMRLYFLNMIFTHKIIFFNIVNMLVFRYN